jgi:hypothetical protein
MGVQRHGSAKVREWAHGRAGGGARKHKLGSAETQETKETQGAQEQEQKS